MSGPRRPGRVLVTGASGFLGRQLVPALVATGWEVRAPLRQPLDLGPGVETVAGPDLGGSCDWRPLLEGVDAVVHSAAIAHVGPGLDEDLYRRVNTDATLALGEAAAGRVGRFVFVSSIRAQAGPTAPGVLTEDDAPRPTDAYGRSKIAAEEGLARLDLAVTALRPVVIYGPGVKGNVARLLSLARLPVPLPLAGLDAPRSLVAARSVCDAAAFALERPEPLRGPFIVADPAPVSLAELVRIMRQAMGRSPMLLPLPSALLAAGLRLAGLGDAWDRVAGPLVASPGRLVRQGWRPPVGSTREGIERWLAPERRG
ncbi:NAD-dependent epimerase/dehydratase family protein [Alsobacter sp. R-9]